MLTINVIAHENKTHADGEDWKDEIKVCLNWTQVIHTSTCLQLFLNGDI